MRNVIDTLADFGDWIWRMINNFIDFILEAFEGD